MRIGQFLIIVAMVLIQFGFASAQDKGRGYPGCAPKCSTTCIDHKWHHMASNFDNLRLIKLLEAVDLDEDQSTKFIPIFSGFRKTKKQLREQRRESINRLAELSTMKDKAGTIDEVIKSLKENSIELEAAREKFHQSCRQILSPEQLARMLVFQERFEREILESIREFRHLRGQKKNEKP